jgi:hypothetical protein
VFACVCMYVSGAGHTLLSCTVCVISVCLGGGHPCLRSCVTEALTRTRHTHTHTRARPHHPQVILDTLALSAAIKKTPVVVGNCTGCVHGAAGAFFLFARVTLLRGRVRWLGDRVRVCVCFGAGGRVFCVAKAVWLGH